MRLVSLAAIAALALAAPAYAQQGASKDPAAAPAGTYAIDGRHVGVVARVLHGGGFSYSIFRFDRVSGAVQWDPANIERSSVTVKVDPKSITSNVPGFADELAGEKFLNSAKWPEATFVSKSVRRTGPTTGEITGDLTLMGVTKPLVVNAELVGAGQGMRAPTVGFHGVAKLNRNDFGLTQMAGAIGAEIELVIDFEANKAP